MTTTPIEFFWDPASPYTYLASTRIGAIAAECGVDVDWRPFLLGGAFQATGNAPPAKVPAKGKYLFTDLAHWARYYRVPLSFPQVFPVNSIKALRAGLVAAEQGLGPEFAKAVMAAHWGAGRDIGDTEVLANVIAGIGLDADTVAERIQTQPIKDLLKANTEEAVARGAFGAPTFFAGDAMFWGNDRLELLRAYLLGELAA